MSKKSLALVIIQFSILAFFALDGFTRLDSWLLFPQIAAFLLSIWGVVVMRNFNVQPEVKHSAQMVSRGPYQIIRNPMYSGIILFFGISVILQFNLLRFAIYILLVIVLVMKILMEERFLAEKFGHLYLEYKKSTWRLLPYFY